MWVSVSLKQLSKSSAEASSTSGGMNQNGLPAGFLEEVADTDLMELLGSDPVQTTDFNNDEFEKLMGEDFMSLSCLW